MCVKPVTMVWRKYKWLYWILAHLRARQSWFESDSSHYFFDSLPHVLGSRPSSLRLTAKRRPPWESEGNFASKWGGLFKKKLKFFMHKVLSQLYFTLFLRFVAKKNNFSVFVSSRRFWSKSIFLIGSEKFTV